MISMTPMCCNICSIKLSWVGRDDLATAWPDCSLPGEAESGGGQRTIWRDRTEGVTFCQLKSKYPDRQTCEPFSMNCLKTRWLQHENFRVFMTDPSSFMGFHGYRLARCRQKQYSIYLPFVRVSVVSGWLWHSLCRRCWRGAQRSNRPWLASFECRGGDGMSVPGKRKTLQIRRPWKVNNCSSWCGLTTSSTVDITNTVFKARNSSKGFRAFNIFDHVAFSTLGIKCCDPCLTAC